MSSTAPAAVKTLADLYPADESGWRSTVIDGWHFDIVNTGDMFCYVVPGGEEDSILMTSNPAEIAPFLRGYVAGHELGIIEGKAYAQSDMRRALGL